MLPRSLLSTAQRSTRRAFSTTVARRMTPLVTSQAPVFFDKCMDQVIPAFRVLDGEGSVLPEVPQEWKDKLEAIPDEVLVKMYRTQAFLPLSDNILSSSQRQGRISFYMTSYGEEGCKSERWYLGSSPQADRPHLPKPSSDLQQHGQQTMRSLLSTEVSRGRAEVAEVGLLTRFSLSQRSECCSGAITRE